VCVRVCLCAHTHTHALHCKLFSQHRGGLCIISKPRDYSATLKASDLTPGERDPREERGSEERGEGLGGGG